MPINFEGDYWLASKLPISASIQVIVCVNKQIVKPLTAKREASVLTLNFSASGYLFIFDTQERRIVAVFDTLFPVNSPIKRRFTQVSTGRKSSSLTVYG